MGGLAGDGRTVRSRNPRLAVWIVSFHPLVVLTDPLLSLLSPWWAVLWGGVGGIPSERVPRRRDELARGVKSLNFNRRPLSYSPSLHRPQPPTPYPTHSLCLLRTTRRPRRRGSRSSQERTHPLPFRRSALPPSNLVPSSHLTERRPPFRSIT